MDNEEKTISITDTSTIEQIRNTSHKIVRKLGFMQPTMAAASLPPYAMHALLKIGLHGGLTAMELSRTHLEKSGVSP